MSEEWAIALKLLHKANIDNCRRLLHAGLTETERAFVERQLAEAQRALRTPLKTAAPTDIPDDAA